MKHVIAAAALYGLLYVPAFGQSMPSTWRSSLDTGNPADVIRSVGGSDSVAAWLGRKADVLSCRTRDKDVFLGGNNSVSQLVDGSRYSNAVGTGRVSLYLSAFAVNNLMAYGDALGAPIGVAGSRKITANFSPYAPGISEEWYDKYGTPSLPASAHNDGGVGDTVNGPVWYAQIGFQPTIMMMNINTGGTDAGNLSQFQTATSDIKAGYTSVKYVWPFINDYAGQHPDWTNDSYWSGRKQIIQYAGGVGIDVPVGIGYQDPHWMPSVINEIRWANANGIRTVMLLTPFNTDTSTNSAGGQFSFDADFEAHTKWFVAKLRAANALPSAWIVSNYSNWGQNSDGSLRTSNMIGTDTDTAGQSVAAMARWVAENAPTSPYVALPAGSEGGKVVPCAAHVEGGVTGPNQTIGAQTLGLGSMAYEDVANPKVDTLAVDQSAKIGANLTVSTLLHVGGVAFFLDNLTMNSGKAIVLGGDGPNPSYLVGDGNSNSVLTGSAEIKGNTTSDGDLHVQGTGIFTQNVHINIGKSLVLGAGGSTPSYFGADGNGNSTLTGNLNVVGDLQGKTLSGDVGSGTVGDQTLATLSTLTNGAAQAGGPNTFLLEQHFAGGGSFSDPDPGVVRDAKFGVNGIAVRGGTKTDTLNVTGATGSGNAFACWNAAGTIYRSATACN